jgi:ATP-dependent Lon protease
MDPKNLSDILKELASAAEGETEGREEPGSSETSENEGENEPNQRIPEELNLLPLREVVIVPSLVAPLGVGRENSIKLINDSTEGGNRLIAVACMKDPSVENPTLEDI